MFLYARHTRGPEPDGLHRWVGLGWRGWEPTHKPRVVGTGAPEFLVAERADAFLPEALCPP